MTLRVQRFVGDDLTIHIGWLQILRWSRVLAAARERYVHGLVFIGPWPVAEW
jgi:hypothetical protein